MIGTRYYVRSRRAYTPRGWPPLLLAVVLAILAVQVLSVPGIVAGLIGGAVGFAVMQARWMLWRWRHPVVTHDQYIEDLRRAARWN